MSISDKSEPLTTDLSTTESDEERMRRALADLGGQGQRARVASARPGAASSSAPPAASKPGQASPRPRPVDFNQATKWGQPNRPQVSSNNLQGGSGPRRNRFAGSADVPVVHLPLGPGRERAREPAVAEQTAPARIVVDERPLREAQSKLDAVCSQLGLAELKLKDALEVIRRQEADIAALQATVSAQQNERATGSIVQDDQPAALPEEKKPVGRPRGPAKTTDAARPRKPMREPKPVKWWIK